MSSLVVSCEAAVWSASRHRSAGPVWVGSGSGMGRAESVGAMYPGGVTSSRDGGRIPQNGVLGDPPARRPSLHLIVVSDTGMQGPAGSRLPPERQVRTRGCGGTRVTGWPVRRWGGTDMNRLGGPGARQVIARQLNPFGGCPALTRYDDRFKVEAVELAPDQGRGIPDPVSQRRPITASTNSTMTTAPTIQMMLFMSDSSFQWSTLRPSSTAHRSTLSFLRSFLGTVLHILPGRLVSDALARWQSAGKGDWPREHGRRVTLSMGSLPATGG